MQNKKLSVILIKVLNIYIPWIKESRNISKINRYSVCIKVNKIFDDMIELISEAQFSNEVSKLQLVTKANVKNDTLKFMFYVLLELKELDMIKCERYTSDIEEVGKMLYGWKNQIIAKTKLADKGQLEKY